MRRRRRSVHAALGDLSRAARRWLQSVERVSRERARGAGRGELMDKTFYCRWDGCGRAIVRAAGEQPAVCPHCQRDARWTTEPPTQATIVVAEALPEALP